jgi:hypothetical protein
VKTIIFLLAFVSMGYSGLSKQTDSNGHNYADSLRNLEEQRNNIKTKKTKSINIFVFTYEKKKGIDFVAVYTFIRVKARQLLHTKRALVITAKSAEDASLKITNHLTKHNRTIGNLWFDSHGHYKNKYSSFRIGKDEFSYKNMANQSSVIPLQKISEYCDTNSSIVIGACHGGSNLFFPATDSTPPIQMKGDSLMIGLGKIFAKSTIYASQSWVMAKPGFFSNRYGLAGVPISRKFRDKIYAPAWLVIGKWSKYNFRNNAITSIPTVALDGSLNLRINREDYFKSYPNRWKKALAQSKNSSIQQIALKYNKHNL